MKAYLVGIDFGNGETAAYCTPNPRYWQGRAEKPKAEGPLKIRRDDDPGVMKQRTVIHVDGNGNYSLYGSGMVMLGLKGRINSMDNSTKEAYRAFIQAIYERIVDNNSSHLQDDFHGHSNFELCIASPTRWTKEEKEMYIAFFNEALAPYNRQVLWVINESDAAYFTHRDDSNNVLVIDYGSSTIDSTLMSHGEKVSKDSWSNELGAKNIERAMKDAYAFAPPKAGQTMSEYQQMRAQLQALLQDEQYAFVDIEQTLELIFREEKERAYAAQRNRYSVNSSFGEITGDLQLEDIDVKHSGYFRNCQDKYGAQQGVCEDYIELVKNDFRRQKRNVYETLPAGEQLSKIILSGGACNMEWVGEIVREIFSDVNTNIFEDDHKEYVVAKGIARYAQAQMKALGDLEDGINNIPYEEIYKDSDSKATLQVTQQLFPPILNDIQGVTDYTGNQIFDKIANFFLGLNSANHAYVKSFSNFLNKELTEVISSHIKDVIKNVFNIEVDLSDVRIQLENVQVISFVEDYFTVGQGGGNKISNILYSATGPHIFTPYDPTRTRDINTRRAIVAQCKTHLCIIDPFGPMEYKPKEEFFKILQEIRNQTWDIVKKIFDENQLFKTTYLRTLN